MRILVLLMAASVLVCGCTAKMRVGNALTERGFVAKNDPSLGQVFHWLPQGGELLALASVSGVNKIHNAPANLKMSLESGVEFAGGAQLSEAEKANLVAEVSARTSASLEDAITQSLADDGLITLLINDWRKRPDLWLNELGISDRGWPEDGAPLYVAMVYEQTLASRLRIQVDQKAAAGGKFESAIKKFWGNLKFSISDAASIDIQAVEGRAPVFYNLLLIRIRMTDDGVKFSTVRDGDMLGIFRKSVASGGVARVQL
ncbi:hypothetical protein [Salipiger sp. PrR002]|uniref:hypothetical protein n=1 Tax=Salipiger sp. PrR002 TaxID=2706489 RepID=UPI0013BA9524|nr:hypothetical protein [Salipiger sp. PrR002]NDV99721.1 hypothetical protein [Salipiger sp. PrR002]NDW56681.1 hypothetical protein [Salipiger sp. PrR004]